MAIFDEKKMEQKPVYPTKRTPSYADWALFRMGKELEESIAGGGSSGYNFEGQFTEEYSADYGIMHNDIVELSEDYKNKDILVIVEGVSDYMQIENECYNDSNLILFATYNSALDEDCTIVYSLYTKDKTETLNNIIIIGATGIKFNKVPDSTTTDANKVLTVGSNGYPAWQTPSGGTPTPHTYNNFGEMATALINNPWAHINYNDAVPRAIIGTQTFSNQVYLCMIDFTINTVVANFSVSNTSTDVQREVVFGTITDTIYIENFTLYF